MQASLILLGIVIALLLLDIRTELVTMRSALTADHATCGTDTECYDLCKKHELDCDGGPAPATVPAKPKQVGV